LYFQYKHTSQTALKPYGLFRLKLEGKITSTKMENPYTILSK